MEKPKNFKQLLRDHRKSRDHLWEKFIIRLRWFENAAQRDGASPFIMNLIREVHDYLTLESLYKSLIYMRSPDAYSNIEKPYKPFERPSEPLSQRLADGLDRTIFKLN